MKKITKFLMVLSLTVGMFSCGDSVNEVEAQLYGTWTEKSIDITLEDGSEMSSELSEKAKVLTDEMLATKTTYEFFAGAEESEYKKTSTDESKSGTFMAFDLDGDISVALFEKEDGASKLTITELTENKMVTTTIASGMKLVSTFEK